MKNEDFILDLFVNSVSCDKKLVSTEQIKRIVVDTMSIMSDYEIACEVQYCIDHGVLSPLFDYNITIVAADIEGEEPITVEKRNEVNETLKLNSEVELDWNINACSILKALQKVFGESGLYYFAGFECVNLFNTTAYTLAAETVHAMKNYKVYDIMCIVPKIILSYAKAEEPHDAKITKSYLSKWAKNFSNCQYLQDVVDKPLSALYEKMAMAFFPKQNDYTEEIDMIAKAIKTKNTFARFIKWTNYYYGIKDGYIPHPQVSAMFDVDKSNVFSHVYYNVKKEKKENINDVEATNKDKKKSFDKPFELLGRHELNTFFNESIIDVIGNQSLYEKFGIGWPEPFILEGPPGCGKTYAINQLVEYLGIPTYHITSSSVGSKYIHETAKSIEDTFIKAAKDGGSVVVIDEMEGFMPRRDDVSRGDSHSIEEVNAFLKCLQVAQEKKILVVGMTNYINRIDPAVLRSGRMGTHIKVSWANEDEIKQVMLHELSKRPYDKEIQVESYAPHFLKRPLSDICAVVKRASMRACKRRAKQVEKEDIDNALGIVLNNNEPKDNERRFIGFAT